MINFKRPLDLLSLLMVVLTLFVLSAMLGSMVWSRVSLLQNGTEIVLKTAPLDPRDLLRGYFVRLNYDISRISVAQLDAPDAFYEFQDRLKRNSRIYVKLQRQADGFWTPQSLHPAFPKERDQSEPLTDIAYIRGRLRYDSCNQKLRSKQKCHVSIRYGIEKFFGSKESSKKLEDFGRLTSPELEKLEKQIQKLEKEKRLSGRKLPAQERKNLSARLRKLRLKRAKLTQESRTSRSKRFAVIVRVNKTSGEAAISGLQLDGRRIYDERLF